VIRINTWVGDGDDLHRQGELAAELCAAGATEIWLYRVAGDPWGQAGTVVLLADREIGLDEAERLYAERETPA